MCVCVQYNGYIYNLLDFNIIVFVIHVIYGCPRARSLMLCEK